jgi:DNA-binding IclR family transcriptional regulator
MMALQADEQERPAQFVFDLGALGAPVGRLAFVISGAAPWVATIQVLERSVRAAGHPGLAPRPDVAEGDQRTTGLHPSTAHRILNDLTIGRFVDRPQAGTYRLGMRLLELGNLVKARLDVRDAALGPMRELHKLTHQPVNLSMRQGDEIVYIERAYSERSGMQVVRAIGGRAPLHLTSVGKLFLAHDDPQRVRAYATRTGLTGHTRNSITELPRWSANWPRARQRRGARRRGTGTGRALHGRRHLRRPGQAGGGLSISAPADRLEELAGPVKATAAADLGVAGLPRLSRAAASSAQRRSAGAASGAGPAPALTSGACARRRRCASSLPAESSSTMISLRPASCACITRQRPASEM